MNNGNKKQKIDEAWSPLDCDEIKIYCAMYYRGSSNETWNSNVQVWECHYSSSSISRNDVAQKIFTNK